MESHSDPLAEQDDRTSAQIAADCLRELLEAGTPIPSVPEIQRRGGVEEFRIAKQYCQSQDDAAKVVGAHILADFGFKEGGTFMTESVAVLTPMLLDGSNDVVQAAAIALGLRGQAESLSDLLPLADHADPDVRYGLAFGLSSFAPENLNPDAIAALVLLTRDPSPHVRNWAMFAIGAQTEAQTPDILEALVAGIDDEDAIVRSEAIGGLANRGDERAADAN